MIVRPFWLAHSIVLAMAAIPVATWAHVVFSDERAAAGSYYTGFLRVSHGCAGSPTVSIRVTIPAEVTSAKPQPKPGWTLAIDKAPLAMPIKSEGGTVIRDRISAITWTGRLDPDQFDQFGLMLRLLDRTGQLYFPTVQRCETDRNEWTMIPAAGQPWHSVKSPAPVLELTPAAPTPMAGIKM